MTALPPIEEEDLSEVVKPLDAGAQHNLGGLFDLMQDGRTIKEGDTSHWVVLTQVFDPETGYTWQPGEVNKVLSTVTFCSYANGKLTKTYAGTCWRPYS